MNYDNKNYPMLIHLKKAPIFVALAASIATMSSLASDSEQFSLVGQPDVLFDGGSGTLTGTYNGIPYEIVHGFAVAQGDMVLGRILPNGSLDIALQPRGLGQSSAFERWVDGIIPYQFSGDISQAQRDRAQEAIAHWNANTTIMLVNRTSENAERYSDYINFELGGGCASYVGKKGGEQTVWLADNCTVGSIIHEVGHAIGLFHEHTRPDRDDFVTVNLQNVVPNKELNFDKIIAGAENFSEYDYGSIMHYGEFFFSSNGEPSISVPDGVRIGQRDALSDKDIKSINLMYATDLKLDVSTRDNEENTQIDLVVSNLGELGANTLQLTASWGDAADWLSISTNSGWDCQQFGAELRCSKETLEGNNDNQFSILVDAKGANTDTLKVRLESRTLDMELNNNVFNDSIEKASVDQAPVEEPNTDATPLPIIPNPVDEPDADVTPNPPVAMVPTDKAPEQGAAVPGEEENTDTTTVNAEVEQQQVESGGSSGGGATLYLLALLFSSRLKRRS